ncbi:MAG: T9SS type A sorting domain-containing protein [Prolixibacteraceae bacterium]|jgi:hypothetical protein|nr:T9SS type A sorting domain-containing protein [Prolixibacteraceae bacterium]
MRHKRLKLSAVLLLGLGLISLQAQTIYVKESSGTQTAYTLSSVQKMTFSSGNVTVQKTDNSTAEYALSELKYLSFEDLTTGIEQPVQQGASNLITYPNPVTDVLNIELTGVASRGTISILTLEGKLLQEQKTDGANTAVLNLSQLSQGIYLCRYASTTEIKTVKIIKQ